MKNFILPLVFVLFLFGCTKKTEEVKNTKATPAPIEALNLSTKPLEQVKQDEIPFKLYQLQSTSPINIHISALALKTLYGMLQAGASKKTEEQIQQLFDVNFGWKKEVDSIPDFYFENSAWIKKGKSPQASFKAALESKYGVKINPLVIDSLNAWAANASQRQIEKIVVSLDPKLWMILANVFTYKAEWAKPFKKELTSPVIFKSLETQVAQVQTLHQVETFPYAEDEVGQWIDLAYAKSDLVMTIALPKKTLNLKAIEEKLSPSYVSSMIKAMKPEKLALKLPQTHLIFRESLKDLIRQAGYDQWFNKKADYSKIFSEKNASFPFEMLQTSVIKINEQGTEAASPKKVEDAGIHLFSPKKFYASEPFLFFLRNSKTGQLYSIGRVFDPLAK